MGTLANSGDTDEMPQNAAFHQGLHFLQRSNQSSGAEMHRNLGVLTCEPLKYIHCNGQSRPYIAFTLYLYGKIHQNTKG